MNVKNQESYHGNKETSAKFELTACFNGQFA